MKTTRTLLFAVLMLVVAACGEGKWHTHDAFTRPTQAGGNAAVYFLLHNATSHDDALLGASTDVAEVVEMHKSAMADDLDGMVAGGQEADHEHAEGEEEHEHEGDAEHAMSDMEAQDLASVGSMTLQQRVDVAAAHEIEFAPGGYHLMLVNLTRELVAGDHFELTLQFEHSEDLTLEVHVIAP
jgi:copper(I)-binding protein